MKCELILFVVFYCRPNHFEYCIGNLSTVVSKTSARIVVYVTILVTRIFSCCLGLCFVKVSCVEFYEKNQILYEM